MQHKARLALSPEAIKPPTVRSQSVRYMLAKSRPAPTFADRLLRACALGASAGFMLSLAIVLVRMF